MKIIYSIFLLLVLTNIAYAEGLVTDKFGQLVPVSFDSKLIEAKEYRLPYNEKYDPEKSIEVLESMVSKKPDYYRGYYNLGLAYSELNEYEKSKSSFDKALEIRSKNTIEDVTIFNSAGWSSLKAQDYKEAEVLFKKGIEEKDKNTLRSNRSLYNNLGLLYFYTQRFDKAEAYLNIAKDKYKSKSAAQTLQVIKELEIVKIKNANKANALGQ